MTLRKESLIDPHEELLEFHKTRCVARLRMLNGEGSVSNWASHFPVTNEVLVRWV